MKVQSIRSLLTLVATVSVVVAVAGCGSSSASSSSSAPGVTKTSITFGTHQPLTGPAAPGYSEIAPASQAFFDYVNAHGGVFGRKIHLLIKDDAYNPTNTVNVVHQLVLQDNVFGIFEGLGTPTHTKVVGFLNSSKVPDLFVASGCPCWDKGTSQPETFGWQPNYTIEGKILGQYLKQHFAGQKIAVLYQDDDFGQGGLAGIKDEVPAADIVSTEPYQSGTTTLAPQITAIKAAKAQVLVDFTVPIYTAIAQLTSFTLGYKPQLVVSNVGIDPTTVGALLKSVSRARSPTAISPPALIPPTRGSSCS
jgi:branched-chain amino acid transport system substrate-binding protein